jgi:CMP-N,N'-diacetyllegionaminic acid synthase
VTDSPAKVLCLVNARAGSKRLPGKNLRPFLGEPLIVHTLRAALSSGCVDRVVVSTDAEEIAAVSRAHGAEVPFLRPAALATDSASSIDVVLHVLDELSGREGYRPDVVVLLQPTSPLRTARHLSEAFAILAPEVGAIVSVYGCKPPTWTYRLTVNGHITPAIPDEAPVAPHGGDRFVMPNGAIYIARADYLRAHLGFMGPDTIGYMMAPDSSVDIDDEADFAFAERIARCAPT